MTQQNFKILFVTGGTITIIGAIAQLFDVKIAPFLFTFGAAVLIYLHFTTAMAKKNADLRVQRLSRMGFTSSLLLALASYFMFTSSNLWVIAVLIYALVSLFLSFRSE